MSKKLSYTSEDKIIHCASCGEANTHQEGFIWFQRAEDASQGLAVFVTSSGDHRSIPYNDGPDSPNPSSRRHGSIVVFSCEHCDVLTGVHFAQHKGVTIVETKKVEESMTSTTTSFDPERLEIAAWSIGT